MIRKATESDLDAIKLIASLTWHTAYRDILPQEAITQFMDDVYSPETLHHRLKTTEYIVIEEEGYIVGYSNYERRDTNLHILAVFVLEPYQRRGFGQQMMDYIEHNDTDDVTHSYVDVVSNNKSANQFYKKCGFEELICNPDSLYGYPLKMNRLIFNF